MAAAKARPIAQLARAPKCLGSLDDHPLARDAPALHISL